MQIPCKHLQWICELFKRLNSLKNLVCTGAVCHRRHPPFVTLLRHSLYRTLVVPPYPKLRATVLSLSSPFSRFPLCPSICQFLPRLSYPFVFLTIDILPSVKKRTNLPPPRLFLPSTRCRTNNTSGKSVEITAEDKSAAAHSSQSIF